jgi:hypothetical protein
MVDHHAGSVGDCGHHHRGQSLCLFLTLLVVPVAYVKPTRPSTLLSTERRCN